MNVERMLLLADRIEKDAKHFNMGEWFSKHTYVAPIKAVVTKEGKFRCGTAACIAGHAALMFSGDVTKIDLCDVQMIATEKLDLTNEEACELFFFVAGHAELDKVTVKEAAAKIREMTKPYL